MSDLFKKTEDAFAILFSKGVYRQAPLYTKGGELFAKYGSGFIRLYDKGTTSVPSVTHTDLIHAGKLVVGPIGRLSLTGDEKLKVVR